MCWAEPFLIIGNQKQLKGARLNDKHEQVWIAINNAGNDKLKTNHWDLHLCFFSPCTTHWLQHHHYIGQLACRNAHECFSLTALLNSAALKCCKDPLKTVCHTHLYRMSRLWSEHIFAFIAATQFVVGHVSRISSCIRSSHHISIIISLLYCLLYAFIKEYCSVIHLIISMKYFC